MNGNLDPRAARCLNLGLGKREFAGIGTQVKVTCFDSTFQTFGFEQMLFLGGKLYAVESRIEK